MIVGGKIDFVEATKTSEDTLKGLNINISMEEVKVKGESIELAYTYTVAYDEGVGNLKMKGTIYAKEDKKLAKEIEDEWKKNKKLPDAYAEGILNAINYNGSANGTLAARIVNLSPPLIPPRLQLSKK